MNRIWARFWCQRSYRAGVKQVAFKKFSGTLGARFDELTICDDFALWGDPVGSAQIIVVYLRERSGFDKIDDM